MINLKALFRKKTKLQIAISNIEKINTSKSSIVYSSDISIYKLLTLCKNINTYITLLERILHHLKEDTIIPISTLPQTPLVIYLNDFYLDDKNHYLDVKRTTTRFKELTIEFLTMYNNLELSIEKTFNQEKNLLYLNNITNNLILIFLEIKKCLK
jgi:hypothetical protein